MLAQDLQFRLDHITSQIAEVEQRLTQFPEGHIRCTQNGKYVKTQYVLDGKAMTLSKKQQGFARIMMEKKYLEASLQDLLVEKEALEACCRHGTSSASRVEQLLNKPAYRALLSDALKPVSQKMKAWMEEPFESNPSHPEQLRHPCLSGHMVRSKSEVLIDQALFLHQIPFRYECQLRLGDVTLFPDFTLLHPVTGQLLIWEHFGKMDLASYAQNAFQKMQLYNSYGYTLNLNLITTCETKDQPLTTRTIENMIQHYLL